MSTVEAPVVVLSSSTVELSAVKAVPVLILPLVILDVIPAGDLSQTSATVAARRVVYRLLLLIILVYVIGLVVSHFDCNTQEEHI